MEKSLWTNVRGEKKQDENFVHTTDTHKYADK